METSSIRRRIVIKKILFTIVFLSLFFNLLQAQQYFPLKVGNNWWYRDDRGTIIVRKVKRQITNKRLTKLPDIAAGEEFNPPFDYQYDFVEWESSIFPSSPDPVEESTVKRRKHEAEEEFRTFRLGYLLKHHSNDPVIKSYIQTIEFDRRFLLEDEKHRSYEIIGTKRRFMYEFYELINGIVLVDCYGIVLPPNLNVGDKWKTKDCWGQKYKYEVIYKNASVATPMGTFYNCLKIRRCKFSAGICGEDRNLYYAIGIGLVKETDPLAIDWDDEGRIIRIEKTLKELIKYKVNGALIKKIN